MFPVKVKTKIKDKNTNEIYKKGTLLIVNENRYKEMKKYVTKSLTKAEENKAEKLNKVIVKEESEE